MRRCLLFALLLTVSLATPALSDKRVALVIDNSAYQNVAVMIALLAAPKGRCDTCCCHCTRNMNFYLR
jgi:hypothetical protein